MAYNVFFDGSSSEGYPETPRLRVAFRHNMQDYTRLVYMIILA